MFPSRVARMNTIGNLVQKKLMISGSYASKGYIIHDVSVDKNHCTLVRRTRLCLINIDNTVYFATAETSLSFRYFVQAIINFERRHTLILSLTIYEFIRHVTQLHNELIFVAELHTGQQLSFGVHRIMQANWVYAYLQE